MTSRSPLTVRAPISVFHLGKIESIQLETSGRVVSKFSGDNQSVVRNKGELATKDSSENKEHENIPSTFTADNPLFNELQNLMDYGDRIASAIKINYGDLKEVFLPLLLEKKVITPEQEQDFRKNTDKIIPYLQQAIKQIEESI